MDKCLTGKNSGWAYVPRGFYPVSAEREWVQVINIILCDYQHNTEKLTKLYKILNFGVNEANYYYYYYYYYCNKQDTAIQNLQNVQRNIWMFSQPAL